MLPESERRKAISRLTKDDAEKLLYDWEFWARPKQLPPDWPWYVWLILSGRGFGKTRTGNEMVIRWAKAGYSPIALIGQTKADVRDTIIEIGESSLLRISPPWFRPEYEPSKRRVIWPNGTIAVAFSGDEPDQLRGPQHSKALVDELCLVAGTLIETKRGQIPIENVIPDDFLWTRKGWRRVKASGCTGKNKPVISALFSNGSALTGTPTHHVFVFGKGFTPLTKLRYPDKIYTYQEDVKCQAKKSFITGASIIPISIQSIQDLSLTSNGETGNFSTGLFGKSTMGRFLMGMKFIISMVTSGITILRIWSAGLDQSIADLILSLNPLRLARNQVIEFCVGKLPSGYSQNLYQRNTDADSVANHTWPKQNGRHTVLPTVVKLIGEGQESITKQEYAPFAGRDLQSTSIIRPNVVRTHVLTVLCGGNADVYNLEVEGEPEYFANGILVHNCKFKYPQDTWDNLEMGLRIGDNPQAVVTTTPRPLKIIKELIKDKHTAVTTGHTMENRANLAPPFLKRILERYEGTRLGRQELAGEILEDNPGALWQRAMIDQYRVTANPDLIRVVVGVDPPGGATECGIVVAGDAGNGHYYVLDDRSLQDSPDKWAEAVLTGYNRNRADAIVGEANFGGDMVENTIKQAARTRSLVYRYKAVQASRGKAVRAEPIVALYEQGRVHHVGNFAALEDELCEWVPGEGASPNRLDAAVWAITELTSASRWRPV